LDAVTNSIYVDETGIYLCGEYFDVDDQAWVACYWKNGVINKLSNKWSKAKRVIAKNSSIYVIGEAEISDYTYAACYWKDNELRVLSDKSSQANDIGFLGDDLFICGTNNFQACYWLNENVNNLTSRNESTSANVLSIDVSDIYIFGYKGFWKNSEWNDLEINDLLTDAIIKNGNKYIIGNGPTSIRVN